MIRMQKYEGYMLALAPIFHGSDEKTGATLTLRSQRVFAEGVGLVDMPFLSGNGTRGKLRRLLMADMCFLVDINPEDLKDKLYHTLFTGGALESNSDSSGILDLPLKRKVGDLIIPINLLGCSFGNQSFGGKVNIGMAYPVCKENAPYLSEMLRSDARAQHSVREYIDSMFHTRKDDRREPRAEEDQAIQMKYDFDCFIKGTKFDHHFSIEFASDLEMSCLGRMVDLLTEFPFVGGKKNAGLGEIEFMYYPKCASSDLYLKFLEENKTQIEEMMHELEDIASKFKKKEKKGKKGEAVKEEEVEEDSQEDDI